MGAEIWLRLKNKSRNSAETAKSIEENDHQEKNFDK